jgi:hypothetical protein
VDKDCGFGRGAAGEVPTLWNTNLKMEVLMKSRIVWLLGLALAGCVPSWNPLYTEKDLTFDPAMLGAWRPGEAREDSRESWVFTKNGENLYRLHQTDEKGNKAEFEARLVKLKEHRFLDLHLARIEEDDVKLNGWAAFSLVPAHLILKVEQTEPALKIAAMNPDWMETYLRQHPNAIAHRVLLDSNIVLTASTPDLQKFVLEHVNKDDFFGGPMELKRTARSDKKN